MRLKIWLSVLWLVISLVALGSEVSCYPKSVLGIVVSLVAGVSWGSIVFRLVKKGLSERKVVAGDDGDPSRIPVLKGERRSKWYFPATWFSGREGVAGDEPENSGKK